MSSTSNSTESRFDRRGMPHSIRWGFPRRADLHGRQWHGIEFHRAAHAACLVRLRGGSRAHHHRDVQPGRADRLVSVRRAGRSVRAAPGDALGLSDMGGVSGRFSAGAAHRLDRAGVRHLFPARFRFSIIRLRVSGLDQRRGAPPAQWHCGGMVLRHVHGWPADAGFAVRGRHDSVVARRFAWRDAGHVGLDRAGHARLFDRVVRRE